MCGGGGGIIPPGPIMGGIGIPIGGGPLYPPLFEIKQ